ncbi:MAG: ABC transporter permease [Burkholderiales bacterium]|nr:ABC transporter permease [Burkholderiales bacterium]
MFKLALRNIIRQKIHSTMTLAAVITGVIGIVLAGGWVNDVYIKLGEALIYSQSGHLQIYKSGYFETGRRSPEKYLINNPDELAQKTRNETGVEKFYSTMARLNFSGLLNNGRSDLSIVGEGVQPDKEAQLGTHMMLTAGRQLTDADAFGVMLGKGVAKALQLTPGDHVTLMANTLDGALNSLDLVVVGVFQSFSNDYDARAIRIPLAAAQALLDTQSVNAIVVTLKHTRDTDPIATLLTERFDKDGLEVRTWVELNDFYEKTVELYKGQFGVLQIIILMMVALGVANSINMSIFERTGEFGTMLALGNRSGQVFNLIFCESLLLGLIGSGCGVLCGVVLALIISAVGIPMPPPPNADIGYIAQIQIVPSVLVLAFAVGLLATILAAVLPARQVSRTNIVDALRQNI